MPKKQIKHRILIGRMILLNKTILYLTIEREEAAAPVSTMKQLC